MFRLIRTCLAESNVHGLPFLVNRSLTVGERSVWLLCVAVSVTLATFVCRAQWQRYDQHPIVLSLETDHLDWRLQRPAVTMCDWYFDELVAEELVARYWDTNANDTRSGYYMRLLRTIARANYSNLEHFAEFAADDELNGLDVLRTAIELKSRSLVVDKTPLVPVVTEMGVCHSTTLLPSQRIRRAYANASSSDCDECRTVLDTVMDGEDASAAASGCTALDSCLLEITPGKLEPVPLTLFIHHELDAANVFSNRLELLTMRTVGSVLLLVDWTVASERVADLTPQRRQCRYYAEPRDGDYFPVYTRTLCEMSCRIESALRFCDCVPFFYALSAMEEDDGVGRMRFPPAAAEPCTVRGLYCLSQHNWFDVNVPWCRCPDECEQISFLVGQRVFYELASFTRKLNIEVSFPKKRIRRNVVFSIDSLIVSLGGAAAFFLGCSFISLAEFAFFVLEFVAGEMRITFGRLRQPRPQR